MSTIYLDHASATPIRPDVLKVMEPYFSQQYANPGSLHAAGEQAKAAIEDSRTIIKAILSAGPSDQIIFTGSGTESINLTLKGVVRKGDHIITTTIEHKAVLETCDALKKLGCNVTYVPVSKKGTINPKDIEKAITKKTKLISVMYANNEIGTIQPIQAIATIAKKHNILFHTDACQAGSHLTLNTQHLGVDLLSLNASKVYGPKGVGLLYIKNGVKIKPLIHGGSQEFGLRAGTENVPGIVGFAKALELARKEQLKETKRLAELREYFWNSIQKNIPFSTRNGDPNHVLPHILNVTFKNTEGETLLLYLSQKGIYTSTGSACTAKSIAVSHVLIAIGYKEKDAVGTIRFSLGKSTTKKELEYTIKVLKETIQSLRRI